jgi:hypothetical protein
MTIRTSTIQQSSVAVAAAIGVLLDAGVIYPAGAQSNFFQILHCSNQAYTNVTIKSISQDFALLDYGDGSERISFTNLPPEVKTHYNTQGASQKVRIVNLMSSGQVQIEVEGKVVQAVIHNLPDGIMAFLVDYVQTKVKMNTTMAQLKQDLASAGRPVCDLFLKGRNSTGLMRPHCNTVLAAARWAEDNNNVPGFVGGGNADGAVGGASRASAANANAGIIAAAASAAVRADKESDYLDNLSNHFSDLQAKLNSGYTTFFASPTGFFASERTRQWEFKSMVEPSSSVVANQLVPLEAPAESGHTITFLTPTGPEIFTSVGNVTNTAGGCSFEDAETHRAVTLTGTVIVR